MNKLTVRQNAVQVIKFVLFSISAGIIQTIVFTLLNEVAHLSYWACYLTALVLSVVWNFTLNRKFTFKSATNVPVAMLKVFGYYCVFTLLSTFIGNLLATGGINEYVVLFGTMIINLSTEFVFCRYVVFNDSNNTSEAVKE